MQLVSNILETGETEKELFFVSKQGYISVKISELRLYLHERGALIFMKVKNLDIDHRPCRGIMYDNKQMEAFLEMLSSAFCFGITSRLS